MQFDYRNTPTNWFTVSSYLSEKNVFVEQLNANTLKDCIVTKDDDFNAIDEFFERELKEAIDAVKKDLDNNLNDSVDNRVRIDNLQNKRVCDDGHINEKVKGNRTTCDRTYCKAKLKRKKSTAVTLVQNENLPIVVVSEKAKFYFDIQNYSLHCINAYLSCDIIATKNYADGIVGLFGSNKGAYLLERSMLFCTC